MAAIFWFVTDDEPLLKARRLSGAKPDLFMKQLEPLKNIQVWRFSLYYFCVFGAFVALALWLPRYLVGAYGFDIKSAGMLAAAYSIFASHRPITSSTALKATLALVWRFNRSASLSWFRYWACLCRYP